VAIPGSGNTTVVLFNASTTQPAFVTIGSGSVTATTSMDQISPGGCWAYNVLTNVDVAAITSANTATINVSAGTGWPVGCGGGSGSSGASAATFTPDNSYSTPLSVTSTTGSATLPGSATTGSVVKIYNRGPAPFFYQLGTSGVTATTSNAQLAAGCWDSVIVKAGQTNVAAITVTSPLTATMNIESGAGLPQGGCAANTSVFQAAGQSGVNTTNIGATDNGGLTRPIQATAIGTAPIIAALGIQGAGTTAAPVAIDTPTSGNNLYAAVNAGTGTPGSAAPSQGVMVGGTDGTNFRAIGVDAGLNQKTATAANVTLTDCSGTITTGGTAQPAIAAQTTLHGFTIANTDASAGSGEPIWISFTTTAAASTAASYPIAPPTATTFAGMGSYTTPPGFGTNHAVSIVAATTSHKFSCTWW
jgi:hypothetical protein